MNNSVQNFSEYKKLLQAVASMSRLYSDNNKAFIHPRFVEKLYVHCANAKDLSRRDMSFDALLKEDIGVGIKTFISEKTSFSKFEKVAEFTHHASLGDFDGLSHLERAKKSAELRNDRITSDANEYSININNSIYHCLIRTESGAILHEEPYQLIDLSNIQLTDSSRVRKNSGGHTYFNDGKSDYYFHRSKSVLFKKFTRQASENPKVIPLKILDNIFDVIANWTSSSNMGDFTFSPMRDETETINKECVVLPLYSTKGSSKKVYPKSGINQWNAGGRVRKFGEAYIPIPTKIRNDYPSFFPGRNQKFSVKLPNSQIISAKVCQDAGKALMSDPNTALCNWLFKIIDLSEQAMVDRFNRNKPYTYDDLKRVGKDSVRVTKVCGNEEYSYVLETAELGSYERFLNNEDESG